MWPTSLRFSFFLNFLAFSFFLLLSFCCSDWPSTGLASHSKTPKKASSKQVIYAMDVKFQEILFWVFCSNFWIFLCIFHAALSWSLWSGFHWKDHFLLQKLNIDQGDANYFNERCWCQKWNKGQGGFTGGLGVKGLNGNPKSNTCNSNLFWKRHWQIRVKIEGNEG